MIEDLVFEKDTRNLYSLRHISGTNVFRKLADTILRRCSTIFILTGFYMPDARTLETDGLSGSVMLYHALRKLEKNVFLVVDAPFRFFFNSQVGADHILSFPVSDKQVSDARAENLLSRYRPDMVIAVERPGRDEQGRYRTARREDITAFTARMDRLMARAPHRVGIGDGGNEMGLGKLRPLLPSTVPGTITFAENILLGSTSDWASYGLIAALEIRSMRDDLLPSAPVVTAMLNGFVRRGSVDGITRKAVNTIDGYTLETTLKVLERLARCSRMNRLAISVIENVIDGEKKRYGVPAIRIESRFEPVKERIVLSGDLVLRRQAQALSDAFASRGIPITSRWVIRSERAWAGEQTVWVTPVTVPLNLLNRPGGRLTTQAIREDGYLRELWRTDTWTLVQTPDGAMGWCPVKRISKNAIRRETAFEWWNRWKRVDRKKVFESEITVLDIEKIAASLVGVPYLLGGRTETGMDCSALSQNIYMHFGMLIPRHSGDQQKIGQRVSFRNIYPGDLIFALLRQRNIRHVAVALNGGRLIHACRREKRVLIETLETFRLYYRLIAVRRIMKIGR